MNMATTPNSSQKKAPASSRSFLRVLFHFLLPGICAALFLGALGGCDRDEEVVRVDMNKRTDIHLPQQRPALTYAYLPQYSHSVSYRRHNPLIQYLSKETGFSIRQVFPNTFEEHLRMVKNGQIDISFSNPMVYIQLARAGTRAFARIVEPFSGEPTFRGQIIARADNQEITQLSDCVGKRWIAVDPLSAGGYLFDLGYFLDHGISRNSFAQVDFAPGSAGKQEKAILAVYAGKYDIASIREGALAIVKEKIDTDQLRILAETPAYPSWVYSARQGLDRRIVDSIAAAMFKLSVDDPGQQRILQTADMLGIIPTKDSDYDPIRKLAARLGLVASTP